MLPLHKNSISKSFTYNENNIGDSTSPCKSPVLFLKNSDNFPAELTHDFILLYILRIKFNNFPLIPTLDNFSHNFNLSTVSNAFLKSTKQQYSLFFFLIDILITFERLNIASAVPRLG